MKRKQQQQQQRSLRKCQYQTVTTSVVGGGKMLKVRVIIDLIRFNEGLLRDKAQILRSIKCSHQFDLISWFV